LIALLRGAWAAFDAAAKHSVGIELRKDPHGGGRDLDRIIEHLLGADGGYASLIGGRFRRDPAAASAAEMERLRDIAVGVFWARVRGEPLPEGRRARRLWTPRYYVRRSAWHALDHAWEIEDRAT
jgi:hypothetical protein